MPRYYVYDESTGDIVRTGEMSTEAGCFAQAAPGFRVGIGEVDERTQRIDVTSEPHRVIARDEPLSQALPVSVRAHLSILSKERRQARAVREALLELLPIDHPIRARLKEIEDAIASMRSDVTGG